MIGVCTGLSVGVNILVVRILSAIEKERFDDVHLHLNTNGATDQAQDLMQHPRWDSISMSLHHYDTERLSELYRCKLSTQLFQFKGVNKQIINFSCNLVKGYIDNKEEVQKMLNLTLDLGIHRIGFVAGLIFVLITAQVIWVGIGEFLMKVLKCREIIDKFINVTEK